MRQDINVNQAAFCWEASKLLAPVRLHYMMGLAVDGY